VKIADRFGVSLDDLHRWNHVTGTSVVAGQRIRVTEPVHLAPHTGEHNHAATESGASHASSSKHASAGKHAAAAKSASAPGKSTTRAASNVPSKPGSKKQDASSAHKSGDPKKTDAHPKSARKKNIQK
jgi:membrane-bound lytic murein transglycosylase D